MSCMFCRLEVNLTVEHVFPAFMGGELEVRDGSCKRCNVEAGSYEAALKDNTKFLLNLLDIENRYGDVPAARVKVEIRGIDTKRLFGLRDGNGEISLSDVVIENMPDGRKRREGFFVSKESGEKFVQRARAIGWPGLMMRSRSTQSLYCSLLMAVGT